MKYWTVLYKMIIFLSSWNVCFIWERKKEKHTSKSKIVFLYKLEKLSVYTELLGYYDLSYLYWIIAKVCAGFSLLICSLANFQLLILLFTRKWYYLAILIRFLRRQISVFALHIKLVNFLFALLNPVFPRHWHKVVR